MLVGPPWPLDLDSDGKMCMVITCSSTVAHGLNGIADSKPDSSEDQLFANSKGL